MRKTARIWRRSFVGRLEKPERFGDGWSEIGGPGHGGDEGSGGGGGEGEEDLLMGSAMILVRDWGNGMWMKMRWWRRVYMKKELVVACTIHPFELVFSFNN